MEDFVYALRSGYLNDEAAVNGEIEKDSFYRCQRFGNRVYVFVCSTQFGALISLGLESFEPGDPELDTYVTGAASL